MNAPTTASRTPFIIILILLLAITGVQYFFNFNGLNASAAMDQAQIARNVARGQGMATNWLRPIQYGTTPGPETCGSCAQPWSTASS